MIQNPKEKYYRNEDKPVLDQLAQQVSESLYLPEYHIYPQSGLMNDPNGLAFFNGKYHVFFQWYPFESVHGLKHWGHTSSTDLVHWDKQRIALIPNLEFEKNGCYSGNAIEHDNKLYLFYTANYKVGNQKEPKQALAIMDKSGKIEKQPKPVIDETPQGLSGELRDPFVFERDDIFYMLLGGSQFEKEPHPGFGEKGVLILYKSTNLIDWQYQGLIDIPYETGYMLECPSLITIDGKDVLLLSPMGFKPTEVNYHNRFATLALIGKLDLENLSFRIESTTEIDSGFDYYAPQVFYGENSVPLTFGWFGCGEPEYPVAEPWKHGLTMPQVLSLDQGKLKRFPVPSLLAEFGPWQSIDSEKYSMPTRSYRLQLEKDFNFRVGTQNDYWSLAYNPQSGIVTLSRAHLSKLIDESYGLERWAKVDDLHTVDVFVDNSFVEIYLNQGERVFSFRVFQDENNNIYSSGNAIQFSLFDVHTN